MSGKAETDLQTYGDHRRLGQSGGQPGGEEMERGGQVTPVQEECDQEGAEGGESQDPQQDRERGETAAGIKRQKKDPDGGEDQKGSELIVDQGIGEPRFSVKGLGEGDSQEGGVAKRDGEEQGPGDPPAPSSDPGGEEHQSGGEGEEPPGAEDRQQGTAVQLEARQVDQDEGGQGDEDHVAVEPERPALPTSFVESLPEQESEGEKEKQDCYRSHGGSGNPPVLQSWKGKGS